MVPGLKLQLYKHQINSLQWMRHRETSRIRLESDCFDTVNDDGSTRVLSNETGDIHRAITGGASVKLRTKPSPKLSASSSTIERHPEVVYIDPYTGLEILPNDIRKFQDLRRNVACGGLLCDDPGLGKTITVLALILQTPSPSPPLQQQQQQQPISSESNNHNADDEKIFELYWTEEISSEFRVPYLLKMINDFCKKIPSTVKINFPINDFHKSISEDRFASCFGQFDVAVQ
jgi:SNF2 family DNA or RNA helicase